MTSTGFAHSLAANSTLLARPLIDALQKRQHTVATCESLTAGLLSATIANVPGASAVLRGGLITYATELKGSLAGVPQEILGQYGPIDPATAAAMALGSTFACDSTWGISCTGVAGPDSQDGHEVGEVYIGFGYRDPLGKCSLAHSYRICQLPVSTDVTGDSDDTFVLELHHMGSVEIDGEQSQSNWQQGIVAAPFIRNAAVEHPVLGDRKTIRAATVYAALLGLPAVVASAEIPQRIICQP